MNYLGCELDQHVSGDNMAVKVLGKVNSRTKYLARIAKYLDIRTMRTLATALVQSQYDYACTSWYSGTSQSLKDKLQTSQNRLVRVVLKLHPRTHLDDSHFKLLNWLRVPKRVAQLKTGLIYKILHNSAPSYLSGYVSYICEGHDYNTRSSIANLKTLRYKTKSGKNTFQNTGAEEWNKLPNEIKGIQVESRFKKKVKLWLIIQVK